LNHPTVDVRGCDRRTLRRRSRNADAVRRGNLDSAGKTRPGCGRELALLGSLRCADALDLALDRREELPARSQLRLDPLLLRGLLDHDGPLLRMGPAQLDPVALDRRLERRHLLDDARVL